MKSIVFFQKGRDSHGNGNMDIIAGIVKRKEEFLRIEYSTIRRGKSRESRFL